jgi:hypothetical protein
MLKAARSTRMIARWQLKAGAAAPDAVLFGGGVLALAARVERVLGVALGSCGEADASARSKLPSVAPARGDHLPEGGDGEEARALGVERVASSGDGAGGGSEIDDRGGSPSGCDPGAASPFVVEVARSGECSGAADVVGD